MYDLYLKYYESYIQNWPSTLCALILTICLFIVSCEKPYIEPTHENNIESENAQKKLRGIEVKARALKAKRPQGNSRLSLPTNSDNPYDTLALKNFYFINALNEDPNFLSDFDTVGGVNIYKYKIIDSILYESRRLGFNIYDSASIKQSVSNFTLPTKLNISDLEGVVSSHPAYTSTTAEILASYFQSTNSLRISPSKDSLDKLIEVALLYETEIANNFVLTQSEEKLVYNLIGLDKYIGFFYLTNNSGSVFYRPKALCEVAGLLGFIAGSGLGPYGSIAIYIMFKRMCYAFYN